MRGIVLVVSLSCVMATVGAEARPSRRARARAKRHYKRGKAAFDGGRFREALREYQRAYAVLPLPGLLFNIGQSHRNLGHYEQAIAAFRLYLRKSPEASNRPAVERLIAELKKKLEQRAGTAPPASSGQQTGAAGSGSSSVENGGDKPHTTDEGAGGVDQPDERFQQADSVEPTESDRLGLAVNRRRTPPPQVERETPLYKRWWFWTLVAAGAAAVVGGIYGISQAASGTDVPDSPFPQWKLP